MQSIKPTQQSAAAQPPRRRSSLLPAAALAAATAALAPLSSTLAADFWWTGLQSSNWTTLSPSSNFATDATGDTARISLPTSLDLVYFAAAGAANLTNALSSDFSIAGIQLAPAQSSDVLISSGGGSAGITIGASGLTLLGPARLTLSAPITTPSSASPLSLAQSNAAATLDLSGPLSGSFATTKTGSGTLSLSGSNPNYTGLLTLSAGTLTLSPSAASSLKLAITGGTLLATSSPVTISTASLSGTFTLGRNVSLSPVNSTPLLSNVTINLANPDAPLNAFSTLYNLYEDLGNTRSLTINATGKGVGTGGLILAGTGAYSGGTFINTRVQASAQALGQGAVNLSPSGELQITADTLISNLQGNGTLSAQGPANSLSTLSIGTASLAFPNPVDSLFTGNLQDGTSKLAISLTPLAGNVYLAKSGGATYSGPTTLSVGATLAAAATNVFSPNSLMNILAGAQVDLRGYSNTFGGLTGFGNVINTGSAPTTLTVSSNTDTQFDGRLDGSTYRGLALIKSGPGTLTLTNRVDLPAGINVTGGALQIGAGNVVPATNANINLSPNTSLIFNANNSGLLNGSLTGTNATVSVTGNSNVIITGTYSVTGALNISQGAVLELQQAASPLLNIFGIWTNNGTLTFNTNATGINAFSNISGSGTLIKNGLSGLQLAGTNSFAGPLIINSGLVGLNSTLALSENATVVLNSSGKLFLQSSNKTLSSLTGNSATAYVDITGATLTLNAQSDQAFPGFITGTFTSVVFTGFIYPTVTKTGSATVTLTGSSNWAGPLILSQGAIRFGNGSSGVTGSVNSTIQTAAGTSVIYGFGSTGFANADITGAGSVVVAGPGTAVVTSNLSPSGGISVNSGATLQIGNGGTSGNVTGNITLAANSTLKFFRSDPSYFSTQTISGAGGVYITSTSSSNSVYLISNTYTGPTSVENAYLMVIDDSVLPANTALSVFRAGTVFYSGYRIGGTRPQSLASITLGNSNLTSSSASTILFNSTGSSTVTLNGNVTYGGGNAPVAIISAGSNTTSLSLSAGPHLLDNPGNFDTTDPSGIAVTLNVPLIGPGSVTKTGLHTVALYQPCTYAGSTTITAGTLLLGTTNALPTTTDLTLNGTSTLGLQIAAAVSTQGPNWGVAGTYNQTVRSLTGGPFSTVNLNTGTLTLSGSTSTTFAGVMTGTGGVLVKSGSSTLTLTNDSTFTGGVTISGGTLSLGSGGSGGSVAAPITNNGTLVFNRTADLAYAFPISGTGSLIKNNSNTLQLLASNSYSGGTALNAGLLALAADNALGSGPLTINGGEIRAANAARSLSNNVTVAASFTLGRLTNFSGITTLANDVTLFLDNPDGPANNDSILASVTQTGGTRSLTIDNGPRYGAGTGYLNLRGNNFFTGLLTIRTNVRIGATASTDSAILGDILLNPGGVLLLDRANVIKNTSNLTLSAGSTFNMNGFAEAIATLSGAGTVSSAGGGLTLDLGSTGTFSGSITNGSLTIRGANPGGIQVISSNQSFSGTTTITGGTLQLGAGGTTGMVNGDIPNAGMLIFRRSDNLSYNNLISGTGSITQYGPGTLSFTRTQAYSGTTTILGGTLKIASSGSTYFALPNTNSLLLGPSGTFDLAGAPQQLFATLQSASAPGVSSSSAGGLITNSAAGNSVLYLTSSSSFSFTGATAGNLTLLYSGQGTFTLTGSTSAALAATGGLQVIGTGGRVVVNSPLRSPNAKLLITGTSSAATFSPSPTTTSATGYTVAGEFSQISITSTGKLFIPSIPRSANKATVLVTSDLVLNGGTTSAVLDLGNSDLIWRGGSNSASLARSWVQTQRIIASASVSGSSNYTPNTTLAVFSNDTGDGTPYFTSYDGISLTSSDLIIKYTYIGDTNLDGVLDGRDYKAVLQGVLFGLTGWANGDVNNSSGPANQTDLTLFLNAYNAYQATTNPTNLGSGQDTNPPTTSIPDPNPLLPLTSLLLLTQTRKRRPPPNNPPQ